MNFVLRLLGLICLAAPLQAGVDVPELQEQLKRGDLEKVHRTLDRAVKGDPKNPRLLYNRAISLYASGRFDEALIDLDLVEESRHRDLSKKAKFQKGNAQFHAGIVNLEKDVEVSLARWRQSLSEYNDLLKIEPTHPEARHNHAFVRRRLRELLMKTAVRNFENAVEQSAAMSERINNARAAMEEFHEASTMEPADPNAKVGEERSRDLLASLLAQEGERKTMTANMVMPQRNEPPIARPDTAQIQQGVEMLEDAHSLKPKDATIEEKLERGRDRLADAQTTQAQTYQNLEQRIPRVEEKLGLLRMAMELLEKALSERPNHQRAAQALEQVKRRLAEIHELQGDRQQMLAQNSQLEEQAQQLSEALDHFQQASELQPQQNQLPGKAQRAQSQLEQALEKLGEKLMKSPGLETLEQQVMRMEGAAQAFNELASLRPSPETSGQARKASDELERLRQMLAERGQPTPQPGQQPGQPQPQPGQPQDNPDGLPMDAPPKLDTRGRNGRYQSPAMNRNLRDY